MPRYIYGELIIDFECRVIYCNGKQQKLDAKAFATLEYIHTNASRVVSNEELLDHIWHGRPVNNDILVAAIGRIRKVLNGNVEGDLIRTVHRVGYQFDKTAYTATAGQVVENKSIFRGVFQSLNLNNGFLLFLLIIFVFSGGLFVFKNMQSGTVLVLPPLYGNTLQLKPDSYNLQDNIVDSINLFRYVNAIDTASVFRTIKESESAISLETSRRVFALSGADVLVATRIKHLVGRASVLVKLIRPDHSECKHRFFVEDTLSSADKIAKLVEFYLSKGCEWKPLVNGEVDKNLAGLIWAEAL